ncbi:MAG: 50S ribosomal protein L11 methyltransferase [Anaeromyxobacter sp.]
MTTRTREELVEFVRRRTAPAPVPLCPELLVQQATEATALWHATSSELAGWDDAPFWAFPWAGGQALARLVLDRPALVRGRAVFDFAAGSGLCGLAAARAGAASVVALDHDPACEAVLSVNAALNGLALGFRGGDPIGAPLEGCEVLLAGDVFYERPLAERSAAWFRALAGAGVLVLAGDAGRHYAPAEGYEVLATYEVPTTTAIEDADVRAARVLRFLP